jgi:hypothetical protein
MHLEERMKKGQASFEFLSTYGWAFMVVMVMIASLIYFGVLRVDSLLPEKCVFDEGFLCRDTGIILGASPSIKARMVNTFGKPIIVQEVTVTCRGITGTCTPCAPGNQACGLNQTLELTPNRPWKPEEERELIILVPGLSQSDKPKVRIEVKYIFSDGYFSNNVSGEMSLKP